MSNLSDLELTEVTTIDLEIHKGTTWNGIKFLYRNSGFDHLVWAVILNRVKSSGRTKFLLSTDQVCDWILQDTNRDPGPLVLSIPEIGRVIEGLVDSLQLVWIGSIPEDATKEGHQARQIFQIGKSANYKFLEMPSRLYVLGLGIPNMKPKPLDPKHFHPIVLREYPFKRDIDRAIVELSLEGKSTRLIQDWLEESGYANKSHNYIAKLVATVKARFPEYSQLWYNYERRKQKRSG